MFALKVIDGLSSGREIPLVYEGEVVVGRADSCDGIIEDGLASGQHFKVTWSKTGMTVVDLDSLNGSFLNGKRIRGSESLKRGDFIQCGASLLEVAHGSGAQEVRASDRNPSMPQAATQMMNASEVQEALARTRAASRAKQKEI